MKKALLASKFLLFIGFFFPFIFFSLCSSKKSTAPCSDTCIVIVDTVVTNTDSIESISTPIHTDSLNTKSDSSQTSISYSSQILSFLISPSENNLSAFGISYIYAGSFIESISIMKEWKDISEFGQLIFPLSFLLIFINIFIKSNKRKIQYFILGLSLLIQLLFLDIFSLLLWGYWYMLIMNITCIILLILIQIRERTEK